MVESCLSVEVGGVGERVQCSLMEIRYVIRVRQSPWCEVDRSCVVFVTRKLYGRLVDNKGTFAVVVASSFPGR